jgi:CheY-like chemotaxis protein
MASVVLVDDDPLLRRLIGRILSGAGHSVHEAVDGAEALRLLCAEPAELLVTDIYMPELDGLELIAACRELYPALPVIALSGGGELGELAPLRAADRLGALVVVAKPFRADELLTAVRQCLSAMAGD